MYPRCYFRVLSVYPSSHPFPVSVPLQRGASVSAELVVFRLLEVNRMEGFPAAWYSLFPRPMRSLQRCGFDE